MQGSYTAKVDDKGRVKVPADFRKRLEERYGPGDFYITSVRGDCAQIYPARAWEDVLAKLSAQPPSKPPVRKFRRATSFYGQPAGMDPQGRVLIHPRLRTVAAIEDEVLIVGLQTHLEVWNLKRFTEMLVGDPVNDEDEDYLASIGL